MALRGNFVYDGHMPDITSKEDQKFNWDIGNYIFDVVDVTILNRV